MPFVSSETVRCFHFLWGKKKGSGCVVKTEASSVCQFHSLGNEAPNRPNILPSPVLPTARRKSRSVRGKWDMWQSLLVWGPRHNSDPVNYRISPNNHCVNHNYMGPVQLLTIKTIAAPRSKRSLHLSKGALWSPRRPDGESRSWASLSLSQSHICCNFKIESIFVSW